MSSYAQTIEEPAYSEEHIVFGSIDITSVPPQTTEAQTPLAQRIVGKFGLSIFLPFAFAASIAAPDLRRQSTRTIARVGESRSTLNLFYEVQDVWELRSGFAEIEQIRALNKLLAMPAIEGSRIEPDLD